MLSIVRLIVLTLLASTVAALIFWLFFPGHFSLIKTQEINKSFSQFVEIQGLDEYVIAKLVTHEEFIAEHYKTLMGYPIGDTMAKLSLVANYHYHVKLRELKINAENGTVVISAPRLYLSTPVPVELSTLKESTDRFMFGPDKDVVLEKLKQEASAQLTVKGKSQMNAIYDKAAKALADNFHAYFVSNGYGRHYKDIVVEFADEHSHSRRQFNYNPGFCGKAPCTFELNLGKGRIFTLE